jgi:uncharacterized surface protein with fasciclin (FAS1) repeats
MKRIIAALLTAATLAVAALPAAATATAMSTKNIVQTAASLPLVKLIKAAGLVSALEGTTKLTVFAPTNAAFAKVPKATLTKLGGDPALLKKVLLYHVVKGEHLAAQIEKVSSLTTLEGAKLAVTVKGGSVYINTAKVTEANVTAGNGVIHVINAVLIPPGA